jgi:hypothetical protein
MNSKTFTLVLILIVVTLPVLACSLGGDSEPDSVEQTAVALQFQMTADALGLTQTSQAPPPTARPTREAQPPPTEEDSPATLNLLLEEDFNNPATIPWPEQDTANFTLTYINGTYEILVKTEDYVIYAIPFDAEVQAADVNLEVETWISQGDTVSGSALICRFTKEPLSFYEFEIAMDGYFAISKYTNNSWTQLVDYTESSAIKQGNQVNVIQAACQGSALTFYINGQKVGEATDFELSSGYFGFAGVTYPEKPNVRVRFDNFSASQP